MTLYHAAEYEIPVEKVSFLSIYNCKYMLFTGWEVCIGNTVPEVSSMARGWRPSAVLEREGTVFPNMDRPRLVNNINFLFISKFFFRR